MTVKLTPERNLLDPAYNSPPPAEIRAIDEQVAAGLDERPWLRVLLAPVAGVLAGATAALLAGGIFSLLVLAHAQTVSDFIGGLIILPFVGVIAALVTAAYVLPSLLAVSLVCSPVVLMARRWTILDALVANFLGGALAHLYFGQQPVGAFWDGNAFHFVIARDVACAAAATAVVLFLGRNPGRKRPEENQIEPTFETPAA